MFFNFKTISWSWFSSSYIFTLALAFAISSSSLIDSACHLASLFFFVNNACACSSATRTFSWIAFSLADSFDDLEFEVQFDFKDLDPGDFELFLEDLDFHSSFTNFSPSFNQLWILCLKAKTLSSISLNHILFCITVIQLNHFLMLSISLNTSFSCCSSYFTVISFVYNKTSMLLIFLLMLETNAFFFLSRMDILYCFPFSVKILFCFPASISSIWCALEFSCWKWSSVN